MMNRISQLLKDNSALTEEKLNEYMPLTDELFSVLTEAMRYSTSAGGKRIRPFLVMQFCRMFGGNAAAAYPFACAIEMIHTYSLIHDDMPEMDNDDMRRGRPTNHKVYGAATALLAGDALLTKAFETAASNKYTSVQAVVSAISLLSENAGAYGMCGGQMLDLIGETRDWDFETLKYMHSLKTGKLIEASCLLGVYAAGKCGDKSAEEKAKKYAHGVGLSFQIIDDILDVTSDAQTMGKSLSDSDNKKTTFMTFMSPAEAYSYAKELTDESIKAIFDVAGSDILCETAIYLLDRKA